MDDDFRIPLERRLAALHEHRNLLQEQLRETHHELNSVDRRIETAQELYRREFGIEPPDATSVVRARRETRIRRVNADQLPWREAVIGVLEQSGQPLHARDIWQRLKESGFQTGAVDPVRSVVAMAIRTEDRIRRVGPNTFALNSHDQVPGQSALALPDQPRGNVGASTPPPTHEGDEQT